MTKKQVSKKKKKPITSQQKKTKLQKLNEEAKNDFIFVAFNDGEIAIQVFFNEKQHTISTGSIQRVHGDLEQAPKDVFLKDLAVDVELLESLKKDDTLGYNQIMELVEEEKASRYEMLDLTKYLPKERLQ